MYFFQCDNKRNTQFLSNHRSHLCLVCHSDRFCRDFEAAVCTWPSNGGFRGGCEYSRGEIVSSAASARERESEVSGKPFRERLPFTNCICLLCVHRASLQARDLTEKVETLRVKRMQDKERMKDFEKTKLQLEQLLEFKTKVMESQVIEFRNF